MEDVETVMHADLVDDAVRTLRAAAPGELSRVSEAAVIAAHADHLIVQVVREARGAGWSWAQIAAALQTSAAAARSRWGTSRRGPARGHPAAPAAPAVSGEDAARELARITGAGAPPPDPGLDLDLDLDLGLELDLDLELMVDDEHALPGEPVALGHGDDVLLASPRAGAR